MAASSGGAGRRGWRAVGIAALASAFLLGSAALAHAERWGTVTWSSGSYTQTLTQTNAASVTATYTTSTSNTKTFTGSGSAGVNNGRVDFALNSDTSKRATQAMFSPNNMPLGTDLMGFETNPSGCAGSDAGGRTTCSDLGTITIEFSRPVDNPRVHIMGLGGRSSNSIYFGASGTLTSLPAGATMSVAGTGSTNLEVVSSTKFRTTSVRPYANCNSSASGFNGPAGCGTLQVNGSQLTSLTFDMSAEVSGGGAGSTVEAGAGDHYLMAVSLPDQATITLRKTSTGGTGSFEYSLTNTVQSTGSVTTATAGTAAQVDGDTSTNGTQPFTVSTLNKPVTITETDVPGWNLSTVTCTKSGSAVGSLTGSTYTIPASAVTEAASITCTFTNARSATVALQKTTTGTTGGPFKFALTNTNVTSAEVTTTAAGTPTQVGAQPFTVKALNVAVTIRESELPAGWSLSNATCLSGTTKVGSLSGSTYTIPAPITAGAEIKCVFTNDPVAPTLTLRKTTTTIAGGPFGFSLTNTVQSSGSVSTTGAGVAAQVDGDTSTTGIQPFTVSSFNTAVEITEAGLPGWKLSSATCTNASGNPAGSLSGSKFTIDAAHTVPGAVITCDFKNDPIQPKIILQKTTSELAGGPFGFSLTNTVQSSGSVSTTGAGLAAQVDGDTSTAGVQPFTVPSFNAAVTVTEEGLPGWTFSSATCTNASGNPAGSLSGSAYTIDAAQAVPGAVITCDFHNNPIRPTVVLQKVTIGAAGGPFGFTLTNTVQTSGSVTTAAAGLPATQVDGDTTLDGVQPFTVPNFDTAVKIDEPVSSRPAGWALASAVCSNGTGSVGQLTGTMYTIPAGEMVPGAIITCTYTNNAPGSVTWTKLDDHEADLGGSSWTLTGPSYPSPGATVADCAASPCAGPDENPSPGQFTVRLLAWGTYTLREKVAPTGYVLETTSRTVQVNGTTPNMTADFGTIINTPIMGTVTWSKVDAGATTTLLKGSEWELSGPSYPAGVTVIDCEAASPAACPTSAIDTDPEAGKFGVPLRYGTYTLKEKKAPVGFQLDSTREHTFSITEDGTVVAIGAISNERVSVPAIPLTGGPSTDSFLITGGALLALAAAAAWRQRRRVENPPI